MTGFDSQVKADAEARAEAEDATDEAKARAKHYRQARRRALVRTIGRSSVRFIAMLSVGSAIAEAVISPRSVAGVVNSLQTAAIMVLLLGYDRLHQRLMGIERVLGKGYMRIEIVPVEAPGRERPN